MVEERQWETVIGLEVHAQLLTESKLFSPAPAAFGDEPNENVNEICAGMPGVLPVLNERAVELAILAGLGLNCAVNLRSEFARKNYFYPDLPKGYQISQFEQPICGAGALSFEHEGGVMTCGITRLHLEEDSGKSFHEGEEPVSRIDLNRAGVPLIEIVSEPDLRDPEQAVSYLKELRAILVALGVCDGNMAEGSMRCDANVSVRRAGDAFGTRVELKNMNSFKFLKDALNYEIERQIELLESGGAIVQETRLWSQKGRRTVAMRDKEGSADYRYFPEPDLPPLMLDTATIERLREEMPELPAQTRARLQDRIGLSAYDAGVLVASDGYVPFLEAALAIHDEPKGIVNWLIGELAAAVNDGAAIWDPASNGFRIVAADHVLRPGQIATLQRLIDEETISHTIAKDKVWPILLERGGDPAEIVEEQGLKQVTDTSSLEPVIDEIIEGHPDEVEAYRGGKAALLGFFMGQVMRATRGKANPKLVNEMLRDKLAGDPAEGGDE